MADGEVYYIIILQNILLYTLYISTEPMCIIIAFNYAGSLDNGKLLIGTFPNESDDGESRVYKLIYASTRYSHAIRTCRSSSSSILYYSYFDIEIISEKPYGIYTLVVVSVCESHNILSCAYKYNFVAEVISV